MPEPTTSAVTIARDALREAERRLREHPTKNNVFAVIAARLSLREAEGSRPLMIRVGEDHAPRE